MMYGPLPDRVNSDPPRVTDVLSRPSDTVDWAVLVLAVALALVAGCLAFAGVFKGGVAFALLAPGAVVGLFARDGRAVLDDAVVAGFATVAALTVASVGFGSAALPWILLDPQTVVGALGGLVLAALAGVPLLAIGSTVVAGCVAYARRQFLAGLRAGRSA